MSCEACDNHDSDLIAYIRVGKANVGLLGCDEHVGLVIKAWREFLKTNTPQ